jgi:hypothetical protein
VEPCGIIIMGERSIVAITASMGTASTVCIQRIAAVNADLLAPDKV